MKEQATAGEMFAVTHASESEQFRENGNWHIRWNIAKYFAADKDAVLPSELGLAPHLKVIRPLVDRIEQSLLDGSYRNFFLSRDELAEVFRSRESQLPESGGLYERLKHASPDTVRELLKFNPDEEVERIGNLLMYGGVSCLWQFLLANGTATAGQALTYFTNAQAAIGVGDSTTAAAATQTDLQASSNKLRVGMQSSYPAQTDGTTSAANTISFQSSFGTSQGNYVWNEQAIFNSATAATGRMLNRVVSALGTKVSGTTWVITGQITIS